METSRPTDQPDKIVGDQKTIGHAPTLLHGVAGVTMRFMLLVIGLVFAAGYMLVPRQVEQLAMLADVHRAAELIPMFEERLANGDQDPALLASLSRAYEAVGNFKQAADYLERYSAVSPPVSPLLLKLAELYEKAGNEPQCLATLEALVAATPTLASAAALSEAYFRNGRVDDARTLLSSYVNELTSENGLRLRLAEYHLAAGAKRDAVAVLMRGETGLRWMRGTGNDRERFLLAELLVQTRRGADAAKIGKHWVKKWREGWRAGKLLRILAAGASPADAIALADTVVEVHPETRFYLAYELHKAGAKAVARHLVATWGAAHPDPSALDLAAFLTACRQLGETEIVWQTFGEVLAARASDDVIIRYSEAVAAEFGVRALAPFWNVLPKSLAERRPLLAARFAFDGQNIPATRVFLNQVDVSALEASGQQMWFDLLKAVAEPAEVIAVLRGQRLAGHLPRRLLVQYAQFAGSYGRDDEFMAVTSVLAQLTPEVTPQFESAGKGEILGRQVHWSAGLPFGSGRAARIPRRTALMAIAASLAFPVTRGLGATRMSATPAKSLRWVAFYGQNADEATLATYDIVVLDPGFLGAISAVAKSGAQVYGYLSLGEIRTASPLFASIDSDAVLDESALWRGTRRLDIRHASWRSLVLDRLVPSILAQGFTGVMLDTLDTPPHLEHMDRKRNAGMRQAAIDLVRAIRSRNPGIKVIMNRGYALLPNVVDILDALIAESLLTRPDPATGGATWVHAREVAQQLTLLTPALRRSRPLPILSLDYWMPDDTANIEQIYRRERKLGHHPYVTTPLIDRILAEPQTQ